MIRTIFVQEGRVVVRDGLAFDEQAAATWLQILDPTEAEIESLRSTCHLDPVFPIEGIREDDRYIHIPVRLVTMSAGERPGLRPVRFVLGEKIIATVDVAPGPPAFAKALQRLEHKPALGRSAATLFRLLLQALNEAGEQLIDQVSDDLTRASEEIIGVSGSLQIHGREAGVTDLTCLIMRLNSKEELISQCLERQLFLARAARRLENAVDDEEEPVLSRLIKELIDDIEGVEAHAAHEHNRVYYLQEAINASLNIKQNQIVKIFTILSAIFMPPTLIASIYGMNWAKMPELSWTAGFPFAVTFMLISAVLPLFYIKKRGWLR
ncbi:magnesium transporter [Verrucomicrobium sp. GAS474]|uniref:CorA family divalent cation transporter n=1 Tax=Verrucomicrobium sp. GAS474 TaxID=1882831 RepID=UPI00087D13E1|nr:CorA family divalent cation transporter [Verrucomicrobium sp. GAS474]SDU12204.1 magnesium transporter [Verrucomicrobium sp. GAS474]